MEKNYFHFLHRDSFLETIHNAKFKNTPFNFRKISREEIAEIKDPLITMYCEYGLSDRSKSMNARKMALKINNQSQDLAFEIEIEDNAYNQKPIS